MVNWTDFIIPITGFILVIFKGYTSGKDWYKKENIWEIIIGFIVMISSIWISIDNNSAINKIENNTSSLLQQRIIDSTDNANFRKYLKDTFGIEKRGDTAIVVNKTQYLSVVKPAQLKDTALADSLNYFFKLSKDTLFLSPLQGVWIHGFIAIDTTNYQNLEEIINDGMYISSPNPLDVIYADGKVYNTYLWNVYRAVYKKEPVYLNINNYGKNRYVIFGDQGTSKRYIYKNGKVRWIPEQ